MASTILRVGLTGNIAAGKSTVAAWLSDNGCHVLDADRLAHDCLLPGEPTYDRVLSEFGEAVLGRDGSVDRSALGAAVFSDADARRRLESILHPAIREREQRRAAEVESQVERAIFVTEAALLYETGSAARYHRMIVVISPDETRLARLVATGLSAAAAGERMAAQMPQVEKAALADYVIDNAGSLEAAREATEELVSLLEADLERLAAGDTLEQRG